MAESQKKGEAFELRVKALLEQHEFQVERDVLIAGNQVDLVARRSLGPVPEVFVIECKAYADPVGANDVNVFIGEVTASQREEDPRVRGIIVSASGFTRNAKRSAEIPRWARRTETDLCRSEIWESGSGCRCHGLGWHAPKSCTCNEV